MRLHLAPSRKFKTVLVKAFVRSPLQAEGATALATLPYVLRRGTRGIPSLRELSRTLEGMFGAGIDVDILKLGEQHIAGFGLEVLGERFVPPGSRLLERGLGILADLLRDPARNGAGALRADEVAQEKEKMRRYLESLINDKGSYAAERCIATMCADEPYGVFEYGRVEDLPGIDGANLEARRQRLLREAAVDVYITGAIDPAQARDLAAAAFGLDRPAPPEPPAAGPHPPRHEPREVRESLSGLSQAKLCMGLRTPITLRDARFPGLLLAHGILGAFPHSKLFKTVREAEGLCYDASSSVERLKGLVFMFAGIDAAQFTRTRDTCLAQLEAVARGEVSDEELANTRRAFRQAYEALYDSPRGMIGFNYLMRLGGRSGLPAEAIAELEQTSVEAIQEAAASTWLDTVFFLQPEESP